MWFISFYDPRTLFWAWCLVAADVGFGSQVRTGIQCVYVCGGVCVYKPGISASMSSVQGANNSATVHSGETTQSASATRPWIGASSRDASRTRAEPLLKPFKQVHKLRMPFSRLLLSTPSQTTVRLPLGFPPEPMR